MTESALGWAASNSQPCRPISPAKELHCDFSQRPAEPPVIQGSRHGSAGSTGNWTVVPGTNQIVSSGLGVLELVLSGFNPTGKPTPCRTAVALVGVGWGWGCRKIQDSLGNNPSMSKVLTNNWNVHPGCHVCRLPELQFRHLD